MSSVNGYVSTGDTVTATLYRLVLYLQLLHCLYSIDSAMWADRGYVRRWDVMLLCDSDVAPISMTVQNEEKPRQLSLK